MQHIVPGAYIPVADDWNVHALYESLHYGEVGCALSSPTGRGMASVQREESCTRRLEVTCQCEGRRNWAAETQLGGDWDT
jgi:hypothetical protein